MKKALDFFLYIRYNREAIKSMERYSNGKEPHWKCGVPQGIVRSSRILSASKSRCYRIGIFCYLQKGSGTMNLRFERFTEAYFPAVQDMLEQDTQNGALFLRVLQDMPSAHEIVWVDEHLVALTCRAPDDRMLMIFVAPERRR